MTPAELIATVTALVAGATDPAFDRLANGGYDARYPVTVESCDIPLGTLEIEGQTIICGTVSVPEDYDNLDGRRVPLEFAILKSESLSPAPDPVVYLHGGPASGTLRAIAPVANLLFPRHRRSRDVVTFDQRAAALSATSVLCYENAASHVIDLVRLSQGRPDAPDLGDMIAPCVDELMASGVDLPAYNTENNARDVHALMNALGYPTFNLYGISYGTRLALEVMRTIPDGVRSVVLDGVAPPTVKIYDDLVGPVVDALDVLVEQCMADPDCDAAYPDLKADINASFDTLAANPIPAGRNAPPVDVDLLFGVAISARNNPRDISVITPYLPQVFHELARGETSAFDALLSMEAPDPAKGLTAAPGLDDDERALLTAILKMAQASQQLNDGAADALVRLRADLDMDDQSVSVAEAFELRSTAAAQAMTDESAKAELLHDYALLQTTDPSRDTLQNWVDKHFRGADLEDLTSLIAAMTPADVERTFEIADEQLTIYQLLLASKLGQEIYACQEDVPFNSLAGLEARMEEVKDRYAFLGDPEVSASAMDTLTECAAFEPQPRDGFHEPVVSDIPTLVLNGTLDIQTSWRWGGLAAETLTNVQNLVIPEAGHGTISYQPCAKDISVAFVNDPAADLNTACIDDLTPRFQLPDGTMSAGPK